MGHFVTADDIISAVADYNRERSMEIVDSFIILTTSTLLVVGGWLVVGETGACGRFSLFVTHVHYS